MGPCELVRVYHSAAAGEPELSRSEVKDFRSHKNKNRRRRRGRETESERRISPVVGGKWELGGEVGTRRRSALDQSGLMERETWSEE